MKVLVIGGVAAGTKAAAKLKRLNRDAQVKILTKSKDVSYAGCGLPYYISGMIPTRDQLIVNTPEKFSGLTGAEVVTGVEAVGLDAAQKTLSVRGEDGAVYQEGYDKLVIATGASPVVPKLDGCDLPGVFTMRTPDDAQGVKDYIKEHSCRTALVVGCGFIGLEVGENLQKLGLNVTMIDFADQILPGIFDSEMAEYAKRQLTASGSKILLGTALSKVEKTAEGFSVTTTNGHLNTDLVVLCIGVRPNTGFLADTGLELFKGTIVVNEKMETNLPDVYAAGDCAMVKNQLTGAAKWSPMGSTANISARVLAEQAVGGSKTYGGCLGTAVVKISDTLNGGRTGLTEVQAKEAGFDAVSVVCITDDKAHYYPGASFFATKLIADRTTHRLLGIQVLGSGAVDKMVDIAVTGIAMNATLEQFDTLDYAYAPPFSTAIHPFVQAVYILENKISGEFDTFTPREYLDGKAKAYQVIDAMPAPSIPNALWIDLSKVDGVLPECPDKDAKLLLVCARGKRGYFLQNRLKAAGYTNTKVLEGGITFNRVEVKKKGKLSPDDIKRVKALGCLWDKRTEDRFNVRVITRNGRLTAEEQLAVAQAAEQYGNGEVTMTTRLTLEIQSVPYDKLEEMMEFLAGYGLSTGGTGSKVRPVVSCKGTTCQYGLIDTFHLSQVIHERFYEGYHQVTLPHKFKIAVGGCPNNCVKPSLNDIGIVGQRVPNPNLDLCRGCKVCQVEKNCPIHTAKVVDGKVNIDPAACNHCGRCLDTCPFGVMKEFTAGYQVYVGGRWGKKVQQGLPLSKIITSEEEVLNVVEKAILLFRKEGITGERFADTVARLGLPYVEEMLLGDALLAEKDENLKQTVTGGASC